MPSGAENYFEKIRKKTSTKKGATPSNNYRQKLVDEKAKGEPRKKAWSRKGQNLGKKKKKQR